MNEPAAIESMLAAKTIAVVGLSDDPGKPSHYVSAYTQLQGYRILPVNPVLAGSQVLSEQVYASLSELPVKPDLVNVFRLPRLVGGIVDEMLSLGLKKLWVQQGIHSAEAVARAEAGGIQVVMDRCIMVEHAHARATGRRSPTMKSI